MNDTVSLLTCGVYDPAELDKAVEQHFQNLSLDELIRKDSKVVIKPNLLLRRKPEEASTTHPEIVAAVIRAVKRRGVTSICIADSPGGPFAKMNLKPVYADTGMEAVAKAEGAELNFDTGFSEVKHESGIICRSFNIINVIREADLIINMAKLKTHSMVGMSGAVKNMFGCVPGLMKPEFHSRFPDRSKFCEMIVDLCELIRPQINFVDGIIGMEGDGPSGGEPRFAGVFLAGRNPHAVDMVGAKIIGVDVSRYLILAHAVRRGLCPKTAEEIPIVGVSLQSVMIRDFKQAKSVGTEITNIIPLPKWMHKPLTKLVTPRPVIDIKGCIGCGKCAESCPQRIIQIEKRKAVIEYKSCIKCYCCHEMCPIKMIRIKRFGLFTK